LALLVAWVASLRAAERPNILFIAVDDLNHWVGYLGRNPQTKTPNLDRLAARGVRFTHSYCAAPICNPSRTALMSGLRPWTTGVYDNTTDWRPNIPAEKCLPATFRAAGYFVAGAGKIYHGGFDRKSEWDDYLKKEGREPLPKGDTGVGGIKFAPLDCEDHDLADHRIVDYAIAQLRQKHDRPFLLTIGLHKPHMPWNVPRKYYDLHPLDQIELPPHREDDLADLPPAGVRTARPDGDHAKMLASGRWREAVQAYLAAVSYCDAQIGRLVTALEASAYRDNTIIVLWSDHGWHLGEKQHWRKFALWEEATRVPLLWIVPGVTPPGGVCARPVDLMSIYPTLCDLAGIATPAHVEGESIKSLLADPQASWELPAMTTHRFRDHAIRTEGWRYIRYADGGEELYDHSTDPLEHTNLATKPEHAARKSELAKWLPKHDARKPGAAQDTPSRRTSQEAAE
jgi:arylsulfatase A-like enzyme